MSLGKRFPFIPRFGRLASGIGLSLSLLAGSLAAPQVAQAEGQIRIAEQFGIVYLLLNVVRDQQLIEKHGKADGLDIKVDWQQLSGGAAINDALLSGAIDIAAPASARCSPSGIAPTASRTSRAWPRWATSITDCP